MGTARYCFVNHAATCAVHPCDTATPCVRPKTWRAVTLDPDSQVFPLRVDARPHPFANEFFDAKLLRAYVRDRPRAQAEDSIMRASRSDHDGSISLFCLVARKR